MSTKIQPATNGSSSPASTHAEPSQTTAQMAPVAARVACHRPGAEQYDAILWRLLAEREGTDDVGHLLGFTSCDQQSGVSTLTANLAIRAADHGLGPVVLIDANVSRPGLYRLMHANRNTGLADVLVGKARLDLSVESTSVPGLDFLRLGTRDLLNHVRVDPCQVNAVVSELRESYSFIFVDLPAARELGHSLVLARELDAALLVIRSRRTRRHTANQSVHQLASNGVPIVGAVVTDQHQYVPNWLQRLL